MKKKRVSAKDVRVRPDVLELANEDTATVPAAARTLALFEVFAREKRELTKSELARLLDLPESSCSDLLNTLYELGYVARSNTTRRYYPTGRLLVAATGIAEHDPLSLFGTEATGLLGQQVNETCTFGVLEDDRVKILSVFEGTHRLRYVIKIGDLVSIHGTAVGKALLGQLPVKERSRLLRLHPLRRLTEETIVDISRLESEIERMHRAGWYRANSEGAPGVLSIAISGLIGGVPVGISMVGPSDRIKANEERLVKIMLQTRSKLFDQTDIAIGEIESRSRRNP
jgi:DNA-binding IclR family transcriptional regulator